MTSKIETEPVLFLDDHRGNYIPRDFANEVRRDCVEGVEAETWGILEAGPDHDWYWDVWHDVEREAIVIDPHTKQRFTLYHDGNLWLVPEGYENPSFFGE